MFSLFLLHSELFYSYHGSCDFVPVFIRVLIHTKTQHRFNISTAHSKNLFMRHLICVFAMFLGSFIDLFVVAILTFLLLVEDYFDRYFYPSKSYHLFFHVLGDLVLRKYYRMTYGEFMI